tara:strand:- start:1584 stop:1736 length:153 start_codon:yes stop_codon:yes gene_type:complete
VALIALARTLNILDLLHEGGTLLLQKLAERVVILEADAVRFHNMIVEELR